MPARWLVVKLADEGLLKKYYDLLQEEAGADCAEVDERRLNKAVTDMFEFDLNASWLQDNTGGQT